jgi:type VI secretion system protein ImpH
MAAASGRPRPSLIARLFQEPERFRFFQAVRLLEREAAREAAGDSRLQPRRSVGEDAEPGAEVVRFRAVPSLAFAPSEIASLKPSEKKHGPEMSVPFFGLMGPSGVLPQHYTIAIIRTVREKSLSLRDFFDVFNHRLISLFWRAWAKYRLPIAYEQGARQGGDAITQSLRGLAGIAGDNLRERTCLSDETMLHYSGHLSHFPRSAAGLGAMLSDYFGRPVRVQQFFGRWLALAPSERTRLVSRDVPHGTYCQLGVEATLGARVWDVQGSFRLHIGPLTYPQFMRFMPEGDDLKHLAELTKLYVGPALSFDVQLTLKKEEVPRLRLATAGDGRPRLGWNTWLRNEPEWRHRDEPVFLRKMA